MPQFRVTALGWSGEIHLGPSGTAPNLGTVTGRNGRYEIRTTSEFDRTKPVRALVISVYSDALLSYNGRAYRLPMHPTDGKPDGSGKGAFRGDSAKGVVRDFVLKIHGPKRGYEKNPPPADTLTNELSDRSFGAFYGGTVAFSFHALQGGVTGPFPIAGSILTLTFTPFGSLIDGSAGKTIIRRAEIEAEGVGGYYTRYFRDLPLGDYTATAVLTQADGSSHPLRLRVLGGDWQSPAPVVFHPFELSGGVETAHLYATR
jgi:hypothetical protein